MFGVLAVHLTAPEPAPWAAVLELPPAHLAQNQINIQEKILCAVENRVFRQLPHAEGQIPDDIPVHIPVGVRIGQ